MTAPKPCAYSRHLGYRATTKEHLDDCTDTSCRGCLPCIAGHCAICNRTHTDNQHPQTCPECVAGIREDLAEITDDCRQLRRQAATAEGLAWASTRIPGHTAMIAMGPTTLVEEVRMSREYERDHHRRDLVPPLAVLAHWEDIWAAWLGITPNSARTLAEQQARADWLGVDVGYRASVSRAAGFLDRHLTTIAQQRPSFADGQLINPPDVGEFSRAIGTLRANLERLLHDEAEDDRGVDCFECGAQLVRRIRDPKRCHHRTPAKDALAAAILARADAQAELARVRAIDPDDPTHPGTDRLQQLVAAAQLVPATMVRGAKAPCRRCGPDQGGVADPAPGVSWECPSCRKNYTPGEYATAVRRDLADRTVIELAPNQAAPTLESYGWTDIVLAAEAASTLIGHPVYATTVRKWMDRNRIGGLCTWSYDHLGRCVDAVWHDGCRLIPQPAGKRLVYWPDVADEAVAAVARAREAAVARTEKAARDTARVLIAKHPRRVAKRRIAELMGALPVTGEGELDEVVFLARLELAAPPRKKRSPATSAAERIGA